VHGVDKSLLIAKPASQEIQALSGATMEDNKKRRPEHFLLLLIMILLP
jgi:hypothetical protein